EEGGKLVAIESAPRAGSVFSARGGAAHAVAVGISGENEVGFGGVCPLDDRVKNGGIFGIRDVARHIGKITVGFAVRGEYFDVSETVGLERRYSREFADAVERRVDDFQVARPRCALSHDVLNEGGVDFVLAEDDLTVINRF